MSAHIAHVSVYSGGLVNACPRCQEIAAHPEYEADSRMMRLLFAGICRSDLDRAARRNLVEAREEGRFTGWTGSR